ncbi:hypothetical protein [Neisseria animaloris]
MPKLLQRHPCGASRCPGNMQRKHAMQTTTLAKVLCRENRSTGT